MERIIWKTKKLDAFSISIDELEGLCSRLRQEFDNDNDARVSIEFKFPDESLKFDSVEDIRNHDILYNKVTKFTITIFGGGKYIAFDSCVISLSGPDAVIRSSSDKESWCAGVNEAAVSYLKRYRVWYYLILRRRIRVPIILASVLIYIVFVFFRFWIYNPSLPVTLLIVLALLIWPLVISSIFNRIPSGIVKIRHQKRDIKTVLAVVAICVSVIGVIITAIGLIFRM